MKSLIVLAMGLATLMCSVFASIHLPGQIHWANTTVTTPAASTGCGTGISSASLITSSRTTSAEPSTYTPVVSNNTNPANVTSKPIHWHLYDLQASAHTYEGTAHYTFKASILEPSHHTALCHETVHSNDGKLDGVDNAKCKDITGLTPTNVSIPVTFHFAWRPNVNNTLRQKGNVLVVKSNLPGSAHACPIPPYDACWAQGLYWVPEKYIKSTHAGYRYIGPESIHLNGTYCRTGMPECLWSEYLY